MTAHLYSPVSGEVLSWIMSDEPKAAGGSESIVQSTAQAVAVVAKEIPIYQDAIQPGAKEIGEGLGGLLAAMMAPLQMLGIKARKNVQVFKDSYEKKAEAIPVERLTPPDPMIMGPTLQALTYTAQEPNLREMFVSLLASASDSDKADSVHPSFVEVIRQLSPKDAELLKALSLSNTIAICKIRNESKDMSGNDAFMHIIQIGDSNIINPYATSIENFARLGLFNIDYGTYFKEDFYYTLIEERIRTSYPDVILNDYSSREYEGKKPVMHKGVMNLTEYGKDFVRSCL